MRHLDRQLAPIVRAAFVPRNFGVRNENMKLFEVQDLNRRKFFFIKEPLCEETLRLIRAVSETL